MRIKRTIIAPVILTLGAAGSIMAGTVGAVVATQAPAAGVAATAVSPSGIIFMG
jgi:hypothetical protein